MAARSAQRSAESSSTPTRAVEPITPAGPLRQRNLVPNRRVPLRRFRRRQRARPFDRRVRTHSRESPKTATTISRSTKSPGPTIARAVTPKRSRTSASSSSGRTTRSEETGKAGSELRPEAIEYLGIAFAYDDWNENQIADPVEGRPTGIERIQDASLLPQQRPWTPEVYFQLGQVYFDEAKYPEGHRGLAPRDLASGRTTTERPRFSTTSRSRIRCTTSSRKPSSRARSSPSTCRAARGGTPTWTAPPSSGTPSSSPRTR